MPENASVKNLSQKENTRQQIDRASDVPLWKQLRLIVEERIERGEWQIGELIPREVDLAEIFGLSRYTVRQALDELAQSGYLIRSKKRGTVVSRPKVEQELSQFYSFATDMAAKGLKPTSYILGLEQVNDPDEETLRILELDTYAASVYKLRRLRVLNNEPLLIETSILAFTKPVNLYKHDWRVLPLYEVLEQLYGIKVERAEEFLEPIKLEPEEAQLLSAEPYSPAFRVERITYTENGRKFERRISLIRGDRYRFKVELPKRELIKTSSSELNTSIDIA